jgi:type I restriction-modification system, S subunit
LPLPPLSEQQKIVEYLDNIFAENQKLKNLYQAQINNLDEMKQSFLKKAFAGELV